MIYLTPYLFLCGASPSPPGPTASRLLHLHFHHRFSTLWLGAASLSTLGRHGRSAVQATSTTNRRSPKDARKGPRETDLEPTMSFFGSNGAPPPAPFSLLKRNQTYRGTRRGCRPLTGLRCGGLLWFLLLCLDLPSLCRWRPSSYASSPACLLARAQSAAVSRHASPSCYSDDTCSNDGVCPGLSGFSYHRDGSCCRRRPRPSPAAICARPRRGLPCLPQG